MTREELIQTSEYWRILYENDCERLNIKPNLSFLKNITYEELDEFANNYAINECNRRINKEYFNYKHFYDSFVARYRKAKEDF